jgi:hypothetical protein
MSYSLFNERDVINRKPTLVLFVPDLYPSSPVWSALSSSDVRRKIAYSTFAWFDAAAFYFPNSTKMQYRHICGAMRGAK